MIDKWDIRFLKLAKEVASWSKDPSTQTGAVIVRPDKTIASVGYNGFPREMVDDENLLNNREEKYDRTIHAELNAILASKETLTGYSIYVSPWMPCSRCAVHVIQANISNVIAVKASEDKLERWKDSFDRTKKYLDECGVELIEVDHDILEK